MFQIETTEEFDLWLAALDKRTRIRMVARLAKLARGLWGDSKVVARHVTELREHFGAGYRVYVTQIDQILVVALAGGDKSTQQQDITRAIAILQHLREQP